jgi:hypothetical protein
MISTSVVPALQVVKERSPMSIPMSIPSVLTDRQVAPAQVWPKLSVEIQIRAIGLLAQLILNVAVSPRTRPEECKQEVDNAYLSEHA